MKTRNIVFISITSLVLISILVRETGTVELDVYKSNNELSTNENWKSINNSEKEDKYKKLVNKKDLSILILFGKDTLYKRLSKLPPIVVTLKELEAGPMWIPLYKSAKYVAIAETSLSEVGYDDPDHHGIDRHLEGTMEVKGDLRILGICSNRSAMKILRASITGAVAEKVENKFAELPSDFFTGPMKNSVAINN